jgi:hypothetical protein
VGKGVAVRFIADQRGTVASELSFGAIVISILVVAGLYVVAQAEGVSFTVLLHQIRQGR